MHGNGCDGARTVALVLLAFSVSEDSQDLILGKHVVDRPDLARKGPRALARALYVERPSILLTHVGPDPDAARLWRLALPGVPLLAVCSELDAEAARTLVTLGIASRTLTPAAGGEYCAIAALRLAEHA